MSALIRYNNVIHIHNENVAEHSFYVSLYTMEICNFFSLSEQLKTLAIEKALIHDVHEIELSDIPHNIKHEVAGLSELCIEYEEKFNKEHFPELLKNIHATDSKALLIECIVTLADTLSVLQYSEQELTFGNKHFVDVNSSAQERVGKLLKSLEAFFEKSKIDSLRAKIYANE